MKWKLGLGFKPYEPWSGNWVHGWAYGDGM